MTVSSFLGFLRLCLEDFFVPQGSFKGRLHLHLLEQYVDTLPLSLHAKAPKIIQKADDLPAPLEPRKRANDLYP